MTDPAPLTDEEVSAMTEYWTSPTGVAQAPPGMVEYARLCVDRLTADLQATRAEVERLTELADFARLLGPARMVLDRVAAQAWDDEESIRQECADMAQRIVDLIGHPVTDEPPHAIVERDALRAEVERLRSFVDILSRKVDVYETQASDAGPYMLLHWTDDIRHAEPCDCDLDNETAGEACMANSEWTYAVCVDGGAFAPRLILTLPRRPPEQPDHDGPPLLAIPDPMPELSPELQRRLSHRTAQDARFHALCHIVAGVFDLKDQHGKPLDQAVYAAHVLREALLNAGLTIS